MDENEWKEMEALVAAARRKAGETATLAERLRWRRFPETDEAREGLRVLYEDAPFAIRVEKLCEEALKRMRGEAARGGAEDGLQEAAERLRETAALASAALDDVSRDLSRLEACAL